MCERVAEEWLTLIRVALTVAKQHTQPYTATHTFRDRQTDRQTERQVEPPPTATHETWHRCPVRDERYGTRELKNLQHATKHRTDALRRCTRVRAVLQGPGRSLAPISKVRAVTVGPAPLSPPRPLVGSAVGDSLPHCPNLSERESYALGMTRETKRGISTPREARPLCIASPPPPDRVAVVAAAVHPLAVGQERHARAGPGAVVEPVRAHPQQPQQRLPRAPSVTTRPRPPRTSLRPGPAQRSLPAGIALGPHTPPSGPHPKQPRQALSGYRGPALGPVRH